MVQFRRTPSVTDVYYGQFLQCFYYPIQGSTHRLVRVSALVLVRCGPSSFLIFSAVRTNVPLLWSPESEPFPDICHILSAEEIQK